MPLGRYLDGSALITQANCCIATCDDDEVEPIPRIPQVGVFVEGEAFGDDFNEHFHRVDGQKEEFGLLERLGLGQENAIEEDCRHNAVVEKLICRYEHAGPSERIPRREQEQALGAGEAVDVVLLESL